MPHQLRHQTDCLNCGNEVSGRYCSACGQENRVPEESFWHLTFHAIGDYFHFDSKFFRTLGYLTTKPGLLPKQYGMGKRVSFVHPFQMYIFCSVLFFILISIVGAQNEGASANKIKEKQQLQAALDSAKNDPKKQIKLGNEAGNYNVNFSFTNSNFGIQETDTTIAEYERSQKLLSKNMQANWLQQKIAKRIITNKNLDELTEKIGESFIHNAPKMFFLLLPLMALWIMLLYWRKKLFYVQHVVFSLYFQSVVFLMLSICVLLNSWLHLDNIPYLLFPVFAMLYLGISLSKCYGQGWFKTTIKTFLLTAMYLISLATVLVINFIVSFIWL